MLAISVVNLILSIFGITVSSIFILFWCGRYFCSRVIFAPRARGFIFSATGPGNRRVVEHTSSGVSPLIIEHFPIITFRQDMFLPRQDAVCAVCLGEYKEGELLRFLPQCAHNFHQTCIDAWLQQHATCPVCRMSLQGYFVGRLMAPLQLSSAPTEHGSWTPSLQSDAGSLGSFPSRAISTLEDTLTCDEAPTLVSILGSQGGSEGQRAQVSVSSLPLVSDSLSQCDMGQRTIESQPNFQIQSNVMSLQLVSEGQNPCGTYRGWIEQPPEFRIPFSVSSSQMVSDGPNPGDINQGSIERPNDFHIVDVGIARDMGIAHFVERG